jgi:hypothetical protein
MEMVCIQVFAQWPAHRWKCNQGVDPRWIRRMKVVVEFHSFAMLGSRDLEMAKEWTKG